MQDADEGEHEQKYTLNSGEVQKVNNNTYTLLYYKYKTSILTNSIPHAQSDRTDKSYYIHNSYFITGLL